ncbi:MAG: ATP-dependent DNA helicase UvrD2 [Nocardioidaceae bacterium]
MDADQLLEGLDPEQREVALALRGPVRVLAGAGTGKTRAITHRIAYGVACGVYDPRRVLAVTFTTRAAGEMRHRLRTLGAGGVQARTFHSAALRQARYFWPKVYGGELPELVASKLPMLGPAARRNGVDTDPATLRDLASEVEWAKVSNVRPDDYPRIAAARGREVSGIDSKAVAHVFATYEELKREARRIDMEDVLLCCAAILADDERVAAQVRQQYQHFVVDEFQDVSPIQQALLDLWLGGRDTICVVGDPAQTIYSFAGASPSYLRDFPRKHPGTTSIELVRNYRSTPQIVEAANTLLRGSPSAGVRLKSQQAAGAEVRYLDQPDEIAEAAAVADQIDRLVTAGASPADFAVLMRVNAQSAAHEEALSDRGVPFMVRGTERFFDRPEVRQAVTLLRGSARAGEHEGDLVGAVRSVLGGMGWSDKAPETRGNARDRWESLRAIVDLAEAFAQERTDVGPEDFVVDLDRRVAEQHAPVADAVTLTTMHGAKGLEWEHVFVTGVHEQTVPISYARTAGAIEEERRLLYVAVTRARRDLTVSWARARTPGGNAKRRPSRFLDALLPVAPQAPRLSRAAKKAKAIADLDPEQARLFESLRAWRTRTAEEISKPAFVVLTDHTLRGIALSRPRSQRELLSVPGIGAAKWEAYGEEILALVADEQAGDPGVDLAADDEPAREVPVSGHK